MSPDPQTLDAAAIRAALAATGTIVDAASDIGLARSYLGRYLDGLQDSARAEEYPGLSARAAYSGCALLSALRLLLPRLARAEAQLTSILHDAEIAALPQPKPIGDFAVTRLPIRHDSVNEIHAFGLPLQTGPASASVNATGEGLPTKAHQSGLSILPGSEPAGGPACTADGRA